MQSFFTEERVKMRRDNMVLAESLTMDQRIASVIIRHGGLFIDMCPLDWTV